MSRFSIYWAMLGTIAVPALVVAQQTNNVIQPPVAATMSSPPKATIAPVVPVSPAVSDVTVNIGGATPASGGLAPLPNVELPADMARPVAPKKSAVTLPTPMPKAAPPAKLTPTQIAAQIAPNFNVARDYVRLTQCYGTADFMGAVTRIQASRPGATPQVISVARSIGALQDGMQPMVLAASTVRGEARFRADYDAIARRGQNELASSRTPNVTMQRRLATLDACRADVIRWRGER